MNFESRGRLDLALGERGGSADGAERAPGAEGAAAALGPALGLGGSQVMGPKSPWVSP